MTTSNAHDDQLDADLRYIGAVLEKIKVARSEVDGKSLAETTQAYERLNRRMDEAVQKLDALKTAGPGMSEDLARALDGLVVEMKAAADSLLGRLSPDVARC